MMPFTPVDIVKVLTAVAPIATSLISAAKEPESQVIVERKSEEKPVTNVSITINNQFFTNSEDSAIIASKMQNDIMNRISSGDRYVLTPENPDRYKL